MLSTITTMMSPHLIPISFLFLIHYLTTPTQASSADMAVPGCPEKCGNLVIPYPFGIGKGCYFDDEFEVKCNESTRAASLSLAGGLINIYDISTEYVGVESVNLPFLLNQSTGENLDGFLIGDTLLASMHYNFSYTRNKLLAVGCDVFAYVKDRTTGEIISECASFCRHGGPEHVLGPAPMKSCSGDGCCESLSISRPMTNFSAMMYTMNTFDKSWKGRGCSFLFIVDKDFSDYGRINGSDCNQNYELPLVLDWTISNKSCNEGGTICGLNSKCVNHSGRRGYSCHCKKGYEGNPYLSSGCQDINECERRDASKHKCQKNTYCVNTPPGSYSCKCLSGYHVTADGCILDQHRRTWILYLCLGIGLSIGFLAMIILGFWLHKALKRRKQAKVKKQFFTKNGGLLLLEQQISFNKGSVADTQVFTIEELEKATDNFHSGRILGKGGLGTVYKGMLPDGTILALKKPNQLDEKQINQFINEIFILSKINHRNIVKVLGCCLEVQIPMVVYEYVPNGNLSYYLHGRGSTVSKRSLSWIDRLRIAAEVAGALAYLHSCASMAIFHRDVKSSNILLDENFRAVVSDFGLSRSVPVDKTHVTTTVGGTFGYLDPEYFRSGQLNDKSDVYGFGVVLAELLTGRKVIPTEKHEECLVSQFVSLTKQDRAVEILDKIVVEEGEEGEIMVVVKVAKKCLKWSSRKRPTMKEVAAELDRLRKTTMTGKDIITPRRSMGDDGCLFSYSFETCGAIGDSTEESICSVDVASSFLK